MIGYSSSCKSKEHRVRRLTGMYTVLEDFDDDDNDDYLCDTMIKMMTRMMT